MFCEILKMLFRSHPTSHINHCIPNTSSLDTRPSLPIHPNPSSLVFIPHASKKYYLSFRSLLLRKLLVDLKVLQDFCKMVRGLFVGKISGKSPISCHEIKNNYNLRICSNPNSQFLSYHTDMYF